ncbi:MAG: hypothetical protein IH598_04310 [Bacteroidales bacterium]|nr:hypothetical protein [Bacteroidales bacterium]
MKKILSGIVYVIFGPFWTFLSITAAFSDDVDVVAKIVILMLFTLPGILLTYRGIRLIILYVQLKKLENTGSSGEKMVARAFLEDDISGFRSENILARWEIKGKEWERFKARKCTPEAINRSTSLYAVSYGIGAGAFMLLFLHSESLNLMLSVGCVVALIVSFITYFIFRRVEYNKYGFVNDLSLGELTLTYEYALFCGKTIPLNFGKWSVERLDVLEKNDTNYLFFRVWERSFGHSSLIFFEFPIPADKLHEAENLKNMYIQ